MRLLRGRSEPAREREPHYREGGPYYPSARMMHTLSVFVLRRPDHKVHVLAHRTDTNNAIKRIQTRQALATVVGPTEMDRFFRCGFVLVTGSLGGRYRIEVGYSGNVIAIGENGQPNDSYCAHPKMFGLRDSLAEEDAMICQILAIRDNEGVFLRIADLSAHRPPISRSFQKASIRILSRYVPPCLPRSGRWGPKTE